MHFLSSSSIIFFSLFCCSWAGNPPFALLPVVQANVFRDRVVGLAGLISESGGGLAEVSGGGVKRSKTGVGGGGSGRSRMSWGSKRGTGSGGGTSCKSRSTLFLSIHKSCTGPSSGWSKPWSCVSASDVDLPPVKIHKSVKKFNNIGSKHS